MAKESYYFSHDYNARSDKEIVKVIMKMGMAGVGIYWCIVEMLYEEGGYLMHSECERIAFELRTDANSIATLVHSYNLFKKDEEKFWSSAVLARLALRKEKSEKARRSAAKRWDANALPTHSDSNAKKGKERKGKEKVKGINFSEDGLRVFFPDGSSQELGQGQLMRYKEGGYEPHYVHQGIIE